MPIAENIFSKDKKSSAFYKKVWYTVWCDGYSAGASPRPTGSHDACRTMVWKLACFALQNRRHSLPSRQFHEVRHSEQQSSTAFTRTMVDALWLGNWRVLLCKTDGTHCRRDNFTKCGTASNKATLNLSALFCALSSARIEYRIPIPLVVGSNPSGRARSAFPSGHTGH